jgi:hypothetical protein
MNRGKYNLFAGNMADTFEWCKTCWLSDKTADISNHGGEFCLLKKKRPDGKLCDYWIRNKEK